MQRERERCGARVSSGSPDRQYAHARLRLPAFCHERLDGSLLLGERKKRLTLAWYRRSGCGGRLIKGLDMDEDVNALTREQLIDEVKRLRAGIRTHRDSSGHDLCWHHPDLWRLLPERLQPKVAVPDWPQFMRGCIRYRQSLDEQLPDAPRTTDEFER